MMRRRDFTALLGSAAAAWPVVARGQTPGRIYRVGGLHSSPRDAPHHVAFIEEVARLGFTAGRNLTIDWRGWGRRADEFADLALRLVQIPVEAILVGGDPAVRAAQQVTTTIPILALTDDLVGSGFVRSLARPGGNTTGVSLLAPELDGKRQEFLIEASPGVRVMAALADRNTSTPEHLQSLRELVRERGIELSIFSVSHAGEISAAVDAAKAFGAAALNVLASALLFNNRDIIIERVTTLRLPSVYQWPEIAEQGGMMGYGPRIVQLYRDVLSRQFVKILNGVSPAEIPVEQPTRFELVVNLKAAKAIGYDIPAGLVLRADKVIE
jgi:putative ABC transport system substrate-binding protein